MPLSHHSRLFCLTDNLQIVVIDQKYAYFVCVCAVVAQSMAASEPESARSIGKASTVLAVIGFISGPLCLIIFWVVMSNVP